MAAAGGDTGQASRTGRPPLTERRKAATRLEIAREAVRLFTTKGLGGTSAEDIAAAAGISVRTLWRYFPTKESCVRPLFSAGIEIMARALRTCQSGQGLTEVLDDARQAAGAAVVDTPTLLALVRLARTEPALRAVWLQAHDNAEPVFAAVLAESAGVAGGDLHARVRAAMLNAALRTAVEHLAWHAAPAEGPDDDEERLMEVIRVALRAATQGCSLPP